jgi:hypothetical protein
MFAKLKYAMAAGRYPRSGRAAPGTASGSIGRRRHGALSLRRPFPRSKRPDTPLLPVGADVPLGGLAGAEARAGRIAEDLGGLLGRDLARHP